MQVEINGEALAIPEGSSLEQALKIAGVPVERKGIAVAVNESVKPRAVWPVLFLDAGDKILVIQARQGG